MLKGLLRKFHPHITRIPFIIDTLKTVNNVRVKIDGSAARNPAFTVSLWERETKLQRLQGTRGKKVKRLMRQDKREAKNKK